jgi:hypothetical protein
VGLAFTLRTLCAPKEGSTEDQYEDAWAISDAGDASTVVSTAPSLTVALSDGASSAVFAKDWARRLSAAFVALDGNVALAPESQLVDVVAGEALGWREEAEARATSWHAQEKLLSGSAATLLVATLDNAACRWDAFAIGDVCLFVIRGGKLKYAFPVTRANAFDDRPALLSTEARAAFPVVKRYGNSIEPGDRFLLMTDALSMWFLKTFEQRREPWALLPSEASVFAEWLQAERHSGAMKNDDVTLVDVTIADLPA